MSLVGNVAMKTHRIIIFITALILGIYIGANYCQSSPAVVGAKAVVNSNQLPVVVQPNPSLDGGAALGHSSCSYSKIAPGKHRLAVIVPFRDGCAKDSQGGGRLANLHEFVPYMINFLSEQNIDFEIFIVEQVKKGLFNKGFLFNTGFLLAKDNFDYVALHDVDQVPENPKLLYTYPSGNTPWHMCVSNSRTNYEPAYEGMVGGVLLMTSAQYDAVNGFSNTYWSWGQEDDDMYNRIRGVHGQVQRPSADVGRFRALDHERVMGLDETPRFRTQREELKAIIAASTSRKATEAIVMKNGFRQVKYAIESSNCTEHYSHYVVDYLNPNAPMQECA